MAYQVCNVNSNFWSPKITLNPCKWFLAPNLIKLHTGWQEWLVLQFVLVAFYYWCRFSVVLEDLVVNEWIKGYFGVPSSILVFNCVWSILYSAIFVTLSLAICLSCCRPVCLISRCLIVWSFHNIVVQVSNPASIKVYRGTVYEMCNRRLKSASVNTIVFLID